MRERKYTDGDLARIQARLDAGERQEDVASELGISRARLYQLLKFMDPAGREEIRAKDRKRARTKYQQRLQKG